MHRILALLLLAAPVAAAAQTPADIARQVWPQGAPASTNVAPRGDRVVESGATPADLLRLTGPRSAGTVDMTAPSAAAVAYGFTPADLARLRGDGTLSPGLFVARSPSRAVVSR